MTGDPLYIAWLKIERTGRLAATPPTSRHMFHYRVKLNRDAIDEWFRLCDEMMDAIKDATDAHTLRRR